MAWLLLALALGCYVAALRGTLRRVPRLRAMAHSPERRWVYRYWDVKALLLFGLPSVAGLALLGRLDALVALPPAFAPLPQAIGFEAGSAFEPLAVGLGGGLVAGLAVSLLLARRERRTGRAFRLGDYGALLPQCRGELPDAALLALSAGVHEELFFRLLLPLLLTEASGSAALGFAGATLLFGAAHRYQKWAGVLATTAAGALFAAIYLLSGRFWMAMLVHTGVDLMSMVVRPALTGAWRRCQTQGFPSRSL